MDKEYYSYSDWFSILSWRAVFMYPKEYEGTLPINKRINELIEEYKSGNK